jgi:iodotyrosine deiodinase
MHRIDRSPVCGTLERWIRRDLEAPVRDIVTTPLHLDRLEPTVMDHTVRAFADQMATRRSVRHFSAEPVPLDVIEQAVRAAASAPSGANLQPWRFVVVTDPQRKRQLRQAAESEEREFYSRRAPTEWLQAVAPLGTDWEKPFLEVAPVVIVVFEVHQGPNTPKPYYVKESVGIAIGMLITALHLAGLATLTHTPSPMKFLNEICGRPSEERACVVMPVGYPADGVTVPQLSRKPLSEVLVHR